MSNSNGAPTGPAPPASQEMSDQGHQAGQYALFLEWQQSMRDRAPAPATAVANTEGQWGIPPHTQNPPSQNRQAANVPAPPLTQRQQFQPPVPLLNPQQFQPPVPLATRYPTLLAAAPAPPIAPFTPIPVHTPGAPTMSSVPFNGMRSLGQGVARQLANSNRRASAAATIPRPPPLQLRTPSSSRGRGLHHPSASTSTSTGVSRRPRGSAVQPPHMIGVPAPRIEDALESIDNLEPSRTTIKIVVKIYPPLPSVEQFQMQASVGVIRPHLVVFEHFRGTFDVELTRYGLLREYTLPLGTNAVNFLAQISDDLQSSNYAYQFTSNNHPRALPHERLDLSILHLNNRGRRNRRSLDQNLYLIEYPTRQNYTLQHLLSDEKLNNTAYCIDPTSHRWILHLKINHPGFSAHVPIPANAPPRRHTCISRELYHYFPYDNYQPAPNSEPPLCNDGGDDSETDVEDIVMAMAGAPLTPSPTPSPQPAPRVPLPSRRGRAGNHGPSVADRNRQHQPLISLPSSIWNAEDVPWAPSATTGQGNLSMNTFADLTQATYSQSVRTHAQEARFVLRGSGIQDLSEKFRAALALAFTNNDFTSILARRRDFIVINTQGETLSIGAGIEDEVIHAAFKYYTNKSDQYFQPGADEYSSLAIQHPGNARNHISEARLSEMGVMGALAALKMICGSAPTPLSPAVLQFLIHGCQIRSLHQEFVREWYPELRKTVIDWLALSHQDDGEGLRAFQSHFSTWHDVNVSTLRGRSEEAHKAWAVVMLQKPLLGPDPLHAEFSAFRKGLQLSCANGFDATELFKSYEAGTELLLSVLWTSLIKSFDDLKEHLDFPYTLRPVLERAFAAPYIGIADCLSELVDGFLQGTGIPCPRTFSEAVDNQIFGTSLVDLSDIDKPYFRSRLFCWAATGSSFIGDDARIKVFLADDNDYNYADTDCRQAMINEGKISFRTCFGEVRLPVGYLVRLGAKEYQAESEPASLQAALHHWLLCECINAIGGHSMM